jgi:hypothetical protein
MKTLINLSLSVVTIAAGVFMAGCAEETPGEQRSEMNKEIDKVQDKMADAPYEADTRKEWVEERNEVLNDLRSLRNDIEKKLADTNEKLARNDLKPSERDDLNAMKVELEREKTTMDRLVNDVETAREDNWNTVRLDTRRASDEVKNWWAKFKEDIDRSTKSDKDRDGH